MSHALFSFPDTRTAEIAVDRLHQCGLAGADVDLHGHGGTHSHAHDGTSTAAAVDEAVTGGLMGNLYGLLESLFEGQSTPEYARAYNDHLAAGGAVVSVRLSDESQRPEIERLMDSLGCTERTPWSAGATV